MPALILVIATNNGKIMIAEKFARQHRTQQSPVWMPVLKVEMPPHPTSNASLATSWPNSVCRIRSMRVFWFARTWLQR
jgi:hypothetical protein